MPYKIELLRGRLSQIKGLRRKLFSEIGVTDTQGKTDTKLVYYILVYYIPVNYYPCIIQGEPFQSLKLKPSYI